MSNDRYYLEWELGFHHLLIEVNKSDFFRVIDDVSSEFTIQKVFHDVEKVESYQIENYHGEMQQIGLVAIHER